MHPQVLQRVLGCRAGTFQLWYHLKLWAVLGCAAYWGRADPRLPPIHGGGLQPSNPKLQL
eukprot:7080588-Pyramimonas_sp.AAC.1